MTSPGNDFAPIAPRRRFPFGPRPSGASATSAPRSRAWIGYVATACGGGLVVAVLFVGGWLLVVDRSPRPVPTPPAPTPVGPLRVILVSDPNGAPSSGQLDALDSTAARGWLNAHCGKDSVGRPAWRSWPADMDVASEPEDWRRAWATAKPLLGPLPQIVIFHGEKASVLSLPDSEKGLLDLLAKQGDK